MIKAVGRTGDGRPLLVIGLSGENMTRLMANEPIVFDLNNIEICIVGGRTEDIIIEQLRKEGLLTDELTRMDDQR